MANSVDSTISFTDLCNFFEQLSKAPNLDAKRIVLKQFIANYRYKGNELLSQNPNSNRSFYPVLRLLLPNEERDRGPYNLRDFTFTKIIINILGLDPRGQDASLLRNYKTSSNKAINSFMDAAYFVLKRHFSNNGCLSVQQINQHLDQIAANANEIRMQEAAILDLFKISSPLELKWIIRMLLKELRLGIGRDNILKEFHVDAVNLFNNVQNLSKICDLLQDSNVRINSKVDITVFTSFQPMLSMRCESNELQKIFKDDKVYYVEEKFDGERFQLHMKDGHFKYFSRRGYDYTYTYGESYSTKGFSSTLKNVFRDDVKSLILDGEMMIWNKARGCLGMRGVTVDVKKLKNNPNYEPLFCVFDLILLNGEVMINVPLSKRKAILESIITPVPGVILVSKHVEVKDQSGIIAALNGSMDRDEEGIVFKEQNSTYKPASRNGWWKMKLEYFKNVMSDLDVLILGGYYGERKQKNKVTTFLVGIIDKSVQDTKFLSFARISSGLSNSEYKELDEKLTEHWQVLDGKQHEESNIFFGKDVPDVWIKPEVSCCLQVRGSELIKLFGSNPDYTASHTLQFPRILKIRSDKPYYDCLTTADLNQLTSSTGMKTKLSKRHLELADLDVQPVKKTQSRYDYKFAPVQSKGDLLENHEFLVLSGKGAWTKDNIETAIRENGGSIVRVEGKTTFCMLAGDEHLRISTYKGPIDIVNIEWLRYVLNEGEMSMYKPQDLIYTSPNTSIKFMKWFDKFGDPYVEPATQISLKYIVDNVFTGDFEKENYIHLSYTEIIELNEEMDLRDEGKEFRKYNGYFDKYEKINDPSSPRVAFNVLDEIDFIHRGGTVCDVLNKQCILIIAKTKDHNRMKILKNYLKRIGHDCARIVDHPNDVLNANGLNI